MINAVLNYYTEKFFYYHDSYSGKGVLRISLMPEGVWSDQEVWSDQREVWSNQTEGCGLTRGGCGLTCVWRSALSQ